MKTKVMVFPGAHNLPLWFMNDIEITYTKSRDEQIATIQNKGVDVIHTAPDNLLLSDAEGLTPFLAGSVGPLHLVQSGNASHMTLGVDNPNSGYGRLAYKWLRENRPELEYSVVPLGGTPARFAALKDGLVSIAVMHPPFTQYCEQLGYHTLGRIDSGFTTLVGACKTQYVEDSFICRYREMYRLAIKQLSGSEGYDIAVKLLRTNLDAPSGIVETIAQLMVQEVVSAGIDFDPASLVALRKLHES